MEVKRQRTISGKPERFFALHMAEGLAEYKMPDVNDGNPFRVLIKQDVINEMDATFSGCPVYVLHEDDVDLENLDMSEVDGLVVRSFFNKSDGNNWAEILAITDQCKEAIVQKKWKVSNCHITDEQVGGGTWQGIKYEYEVKKGHYEHLAVVPNPRYNQSMVLTPEEFAEYNAENDRVLTKLANAAEDEEKGDKTMSKVFSLFKREKLKNSDELIQMDVTLPKSGKTVSVEKLFNEADEAEVEKKKNEGKPVYANEGHMVKVGEKEEMSVGDLLKAYNELKEKSNADSDEEVIDKAEDIIEHEEEELENADDGDEKDKDGKHQNSLEEDLDDSDESGGKGKENLKPKKGENFKKLKNAQHEAQSKQNQQSIPAAMFGADRVKAGQNKYGSGGK